MRRPSLVMMALAAMLVAGCQITAGEEETAVKPVWDLRTSHRIEDVGWPEGHESTTYTVDAEPGELTILLPEGISIEGGFTVIANRPVLLDEEADRDVLEYMVVNYDGEPVSEAAARARDLVQRWGLDGSELERWAARNAGGPDYAGSGTMANTPSQLVTNDGPYLSILAVANHVDDAYLSVTVSWGVEEPAPELVPPDPGQ